jgi:hypothetical protein
VGLEPSGAVSILFLLRSLRSRRRLSLQPPTTELLGRSSKNQTQDDTWSYIGPYRVDEAERPGIVRVKCPCPCTDAQT